MAKKKGALSSPFVPTEEQPYPIPDNWCWVRLSALSRIISKGTTPTGGKDAYVDAGVNFVRVENLNADGTISHENIEHIEENVHTEFLKRSILQENDILISIAGTLGKTGIVRGVDLPLNTNQALAFVRISSQEIDIKYVKSAIDSTVIQEILLEKTKVTSIPNLTLEIISNCPIPLSPAPEQQRIVHRIESLFAKLDEAKEKAQSIVDGFELRKSAILHKAFTGELTERWRKEHGIGLDGWETVELSRRFDIVGGVQKKPSRSPKDNPIPYLTVANVFRDRIDLSEIRYFEVFDGELDKLKLQEKDILVVEGNGSGNEIGRCAMWRCELPVCIHQNHIIRLRATHSDTIPEYVLYFLNSSTGKSIMKERAKTTAGLFNLSTGKIRTIPVPFATVSEQVEIVHILDRSLNKEQQAKEAAEAVLDQIDTMKKAILARAFRGELGTNDPAEEWAGKLVKKIL